MKRLLWVGDAGVPSGFARATHEILDSLRFTYDVTVLGVNYRGDPHNYPYAIYAAAAGGDSIGIGRLVWMCDFLRPDVVILQCDGWNVQEYVQRLRSKLPNGEYRFPEHAAIPIVACVAVDGKNFQGGWLAGVSLAIFWTQFALNEVRAGGYKGAAQVIPLGVDRSIYRPMDKAAVRAKRLPLEMQDMFIVGNVNRNQPRKRWDLMVKYFAEWINAQGIRDAYLYLHSAPTGDASYDVVQLARYYGIVDRLALAQPEVWYGVTEEDMAETYNCMDVYASTTQGEGFGLPALESMACGVPCILPDWAAYGDWAKGATWLVPCPTTAIGSPYVNVVGGIPDQAKFVAAMNCLYREKKAREQNAQAALERAQEPRFIWADIGLKYSEALDGVFNPAPKVEPVRLAGVAQ